MKKMLFTLSALSLAVISPFSLATEPQSTQVLSQAEATQKATDSITGVVYETDENGQFVRLRSTASAELEIGDAKDIRIATQKATMRAKGNIAKFFGEQVTTEEVLDNLEKSKTSNENGDKKVIREAVESYAEMVKTQANALLKGVIMTKTDVNKADKTVTVEVGLSPRTQKAADAANGKSLEERSNNENETTKIKNYDNF